MDPITGDALVRAGTSLIGSLFGGISQNKAAKDTNATNLQIARENNRLQTDIANKNIDYQREENELNRRWNRDTAIEMFNLENEYNTPEAQKKRLLAAGINPYGMGEGSMSASSGDISTPQASVGGLNPSMPTFATPTMQTPPSVLGAMFGSLESITKSLQNVSQSGLNKAQSDRIHTLLGGELSKLLADVNNVELENQIKSFNFELDKVYANNERSEGLRKLINEASKIYDEALLAVAKQDTEKAQKLFVDAETVLSKSKTKEIDDLLPILKQKEEAMVNLVKEQKNTEQAKQVNLSAQAGLSDAQRQTIDGLRDDTVRINHLLRAKNDEAFGIFMANLDKVQNAFGAQLDASGISLSIMKERLEKARRDNDWGTAEKMLGTFNGIMSSVVQMNGLGSSGSPNYFLMP